MLVGNAVSAAAPWHVEARGQHRVSYEVRSHERRLIAKASRENAALIVEMAAALQELVTRCDGTEGVTADGSNIQTMRAHAVLARAFGDK